MLELNHIYHGDCLELLPKVKQLGRKIAVIGDPPYGGNYDTDYSRLKPSAKAVESKGVARSHKPIAGDDKPFDPTPFLEFEKIILWGYQHFADAGVDYGWDSAKED